MISFRDEFLSEDDLNLTDLSDAALVAWWNNWLALAQSSNPEDRDEYSHGVFCGMRLPLRPAKLQEHIEKEAIKQ